jgi:hypothetical protein
MGKTIKYKDMNGVSKSVVAQLLHPVTIEVTNDTDEHQSIIVSPTHTTTLEHIGGREKDPRDA